MKDSKIWNRKEPEVPVLEFILRSVVQNRAQGTLQTNKAQGTHFPRDKGGNLKIESTDTIAVSRKRH